jgi:ribose transport system substrate-binding protein
MSKAGVILAGAALLATTLAACSTDDSPGSTGGDDDTITVAYVQAHMTSAFRTEMIRGAEEEAERQGVELEVFDSNNVVENQNTAIETFADKGVDVIVVGSIEAASVVTAIDYALRKGVAVIAVDLKVDHDGISAQIGVDNKAGGAVIGEYIVDYANENSLDLIAGVNIALNNESQNLRLDGFTEVFEAAGGKVVDTVDSQNIKEQALSGSENLLTSHAKLPILYATGEPSLVGSIAAVKSQNRTDDVTLFGWDLSAEGIEALDNGYVKAIANQPAFEEGVAAIQTAVKIVKGEDFEASQVLPINIITLDNVDPLRSVYVKK